MNNDCENVVFLWINKRTGKVMINVQANPNYTYSSNRSNTLGAKQKVSTKSQNYKENWVYDAKKCYEFCMNNPSESRIMSKDFSDDFEIDEFATMAIYFANEQEGFDFRNQLFDILAKRNLTYNSMSVINSRINKTDNPFRIFDFLILFEKTLNSSIKNLPLHIEKIFFNISGTDFYSEQLEDTSKGNNECTRIAFEKLKVKTIMKKFCKHCGVETSLTEICNGYNCDFSGNKVETILKECIK